MFLNLLLLLLFFRLVYNKDLTLLFSSAFIGSFKDSGQGADLIFITFGFITFEFLKRREAKKND